MYFATGQKLLKLTKAMNKDNRLSEKQITPSKKSLAISMLMTQNGLFSFPQPHTPQAWSALYPAWNKIP